MERRPHCVPNDNVFDPPLRLAGWLEGCNPRVDYCHFYEVPMVKNRRPTEGPRIVSIVCECCIPKSFRRLPRSSADRTNVARNVGMDGAWRGSYQPSNRAIRAKILAERIEALNAASEWTECQRRAATAAWRCEKLDGGVGRCDRFRQRWQLANGTDWLAEAA